MTRPLRLTLAVLSLTVAGALIASEDLRTATIDRIRAIAAPLVEHGESVDPHFDTFYVGMVEALPVPQRAERALEMAVNRFSGAADYVIQNAASWRGELLRSEQLASLINTAMNAPLLEVRMAAYEVQLAQNNLQKTPEQVDGLIQRMNNNPAQNGPWVMWNLALIGARGIDREDIFMELLARSKAQDPQFRRWAVDALAKFGGAEVVPPLLEVAAGDTEAFIRERAFCGLAQSGTLHIAERYLAVPGLLAISEDVRSDHQNVEWSFQALREITDQYDVKPDSQEWRIRLSKLGLLDQK